jgi:aminopeptidase N
MAYPTEAAARATDGSQVRFVSTADVVTVFDAVSGQDLGWLFEVYLRQAELPRLLVEIGDGDGERTMELRWQAPDDLPFPMPVDVRVGERTVRVDMADGTGTLQVPAGVEPVIDPENWILRERPRPGPRR